MDAITRQSNKRHRRKQIINHTQTIGPAWVRCVIGLPQLRVKGTPMPMVFEGRTKEKDAQREQIGQRETGSKRHRSIRRTSPAPEQHQRPQRYPGERSHGRHQRRQPGGPGVIRDSQSKPAVEDRKPLRKEPETGGGQDNSGEEQRQARSTTSECQHKRRANSRDRYGQLPVQNQSTGITRFPKTIPIFSSARGRPVAVGPMRHPAIHGKQKKRLTPRNDLLSIME